MREELEVMAVRVIPFPVVLADIARLEDLQRQHAKAIADGEMLTVFTVISNSTRYCMDFAAMPA